MSYMTCVRYLSCLSSLGPAVPQLPKLAELPEQECAIPRGGGVGVGGDLADPRPNHPSTQAQKKFRPNKNEILNREPKMRGPF